jgi:translation initiation factor IF-2
MRSPGLLRVVPLNARPLLASVGAGLSLTAAVTVIGLTAFVATGVGVAILAPVGDGGAPAIRLAEVPRVDRSGSRAADRHDVDAPATRSAPTVLVPYSASTGGSRVRAGERRGTPSQHRVRRESAGPKRVHSGDPLPSAPVAQTPASSATGPAAVSNTTAMADDAATGAEVRERSRPISHAKTVRPRPTPGRADSRPAADSGRDHRADPHNPKRTASAPSVSSPRPPQGAARGARPDHSRGNAVRHVAPVVPAAPPQPVETPASANGPAADPPGHVKGADEHASAPGPDRGRGRHH